MQTETKQEKEEGIKKHLLLIIAVVIIIEAANILIIEKVYDKLDRASFFGGYHGMISAVFTGLGAAFTAYLIYLQQKEVKELRRQIKNEEGRYDEQKRRHEAEIAKNDTERKANEKARQKESFETTFFQMLSAFNEQCKELQYTPYPSIKSPATGRSAIFRDKSTALIDALRREQTNLDDAHKKETETWNNTRLNCMDRGVPHTTQHPSKTTIYTENGNKPTYIDINSKQIREAINRHQVTANQYIGQYFRMLYRLMKFIKTSPIEDKETYAHLIRASLSENEITAIMVTCLTPYGEKMKPLVEEFALLKHLPDEFKPHVRIAFKTSAFGEEAR